MQKIDRDELQRLRESEEKYRKMIEQASDAIFAIDGATGRILEANPKAAEMTGYSREELVGKSIWDIHPKHEIEKARALFQKVSEKGCGYLDNVHFLRQDGQLLVIDISASVIRYGGKRIIQRICRDVSERRRLEDELQKANEELESKVEERTRELKEKQVQLVQAEKMASLGSLVAGIAHEINTPLGALISNLDIFIRAIGKMELLLGQPGIAENISQNAELKKYFKTIESLNEVNKTAASRIVAIIKSLRKFARLDEAEIDSVDLHEGIDNTLTLLRHELKNKITVHKQYGDLPPIKCYPNRLNQVFMNLLVNAAHAIEGRGDIFITSFRQGEHVVIEIRDTGKGIPPENLERIFSPGFTTKGAGVGTGLGLSIVYQIIQEHHGKIEVESKINEGTIFRITLPLALK